MERNRTACESLFMKANHEASIFRGACVNSVPRRAESTTESGPMESSRERLRDFKTQFVR